MNINKNILIKYSLIISLAYFFLTGVSQNPSVHNSQTETFKIQDKNGNLVLNIDCRNKCIISYVEVLGHIAVDNHKGVFSAVKIS